MSRLPQLRSPVEFSRNPNNVILESELDQRVESSRSDRRTRYSASKHVDRKESLNSNTSRLRSESEIQGKSDSNQLERSTSNEDFYERLGERLKRRLTLWENGLDEASISHVFHEEMSNEVFRGKRKGEPVIAEWTCKRAESWTPSARLGCASVAVGQYVYFFGGTGNGSTRTQPNERHYNANVVKYHISTGKWVPLEVKSGHKSPQPDDDNETDDVANNQENGEAFEKSNARQESSMASDSTTDPKLDVGGDHTSSNKQISKSQQRRRLTNIGRSAIELVEEAGSLTTEMIQIPCMGSTATAVSENEIFIIGGESGFKTSKRQVFNSVFCFNIDTCSWSQIHPKGSLPPQRRGHTTVLHHHRTRRLVIFGGMGPNQVFHQDNYLGDVQVLDIEGNVWAKKECTGCQPTPRMGHCSILVPGSTKMFMWGGISAEIVSCKGVPRMAYTLGKSIMTEEDDAWAPFAPPTVFELDVLAFRWSKVATKGRTPVSRYGHTAVLSNVNPEDIFIYGGMVKGGGTTSEVLVYNITHATWFPLRTSGSVPGPRFSHTAVSNGGYMLVYGGASSSSYCDTAVYSLQLHGSAEGLLEDADPRARLPGLSARRSIKPGSAFGRLDDAESPRGLAELGGLDAETSLFLRGRENSTWSVSQLDRCSFSNITPRGGTQRSHPGELSSLGYFLDNNLGFQNALELPRPRTSPYGSIMVSSRESLLDGARKKPPKSRELEGGEDIPVSRMPRRNKRGKSRDSGQIQQEWWREHFTVSEEMRQQEGAADQRLAAYSSYSEAGNRTNRFRQLEPIQHLERPWTTAMSTTKGKFGFVHPEDTSWARRIVKPHVSSIELAQKRAFKLKIIENTLQKQNQKLANGTLSSPFMGLQQM